MSATRTFLVEAYAAASSEHTRIAEQARLAAATGDSQVAVRHLRTIVVPDDEQCLHLFEARSAEVLAEAVSRAAMTAPRIVEVTLLSAEGADS
jgi:hypothetical protein